MGIGASAGGFDAFQRFLESMSEPHGIAFVLIQHVDPTHKSLMPEALAKSTHMTVVEPADGDLLRADHVYTTPPGKYVRLDGRRLRLEDPSTPRGVRMPIDHFFRSLAAERNERAIGIVLSGTGSDGTIGVKEIKAAGGLTLAQRPESAEYSSMPKSAIASKMVDAVVEIEDMPERVLRYLRHPWTEAGERPSERRTSPHVDHIIGILRTHTDYDFDAYKESTVLRRIGRRMSLAQIDELSEYEGKLRDDPAEVRRLYKDLLIGVTRFFRDTPAWNGLHRHVIAPLVKTNDANQPIRIWVPGCSTGEEAYSIAMGFIEESERTGRRVPLQIFATDVDEEAIVHARRGLYPSTVAADVSPRRHERFFDTDGEFFRVNKRLREAIIFAVQDVIQDAPFSNLDLISCRNLLIYLKPGVQDVLLETFHFALREGGALFLGSSESLGKSNSIFHPLSSNDRLYRKFGVSTRYRSRSGTATPVARMHDLDSPTRLVASVNRYLRDKYVPPSVVIDDKLRVQYFHGSVGLYLEIPEGRPTSNLIAMVPERQRGNLRALFQQVLRTREPAESWSLIRQDGANRRLRTVIEALEVSSGPESFYVVSFVEDAASADEGVSEGTGAPYHDDDGRDVRRELQATREDLQSTIEELETANEELETSNEELETSRSELQSLNEELSTVNRELEEKVRELESANDDLSDVLQSTEIATVFLDLELRIRRFTPATQALLNVIPSDVGRFLDDLRPRVEDATLLEDARQVLDTSEPNEKEVRSPEGSWFIRRIHPYRTSEGKVRGVVVTFTDVTGMKTASAHLQQRARQQATIASLGRAALAEIPVQKLMEETAEQVTKTLGTELCEILELTPEGEELVLRAGIGWKPGLVGKQRVPASTATHAGYTLHVKAPVIVTDLASDSRLARPAFLEEHGVVSGISVLIGSSERPWGVLGTHTKERREFEEAEIYFLEALAHVLWEAVSGERTWLALEEREERLRLSQEAGHVGTWDWDIEHDRTIWSEESFRIFGLPLGQAPSQAELERWVHPEDRDARASRLREALEGGRPYEAEYRVTRPDGEERWVSDRANVFLDDQGDAVRMLGVHIDVTVRKEAERRSEEAQAELEKANQLKDEFLAMLGHELRNPLGAISNGIHLLASGTSEEHREWTERMIARQTHQLERLVDDLLDVSRVTRGLIEIRKEVVSVKACVDRALEAIQELLEDRPRELDVRLPDEPVEILADPARMDQILGNLLANAIKYTDDDGRIALEVERRDQKVRMRVIDDGKGIPEESLHVIFEPFVRVGQSLKRAGSGLGVGLTLVKKLTELHWGTVTAKSDGPGKGSEFIVELPVHSHANAASETPAEEEEKRGGPSAKGTRHRVLIIDDNVDLAGGLRRILEQAGHDVRVEGNGRAGLQAARELEPRAVLVDIGLPGMDGYEVGRRLRETKAELWIAAISGFKQTGEEKLAPSIFDTYYIKPIDREKLLRDLGALSPVRKAPA